MNRRLVIALAKFFRPVVDEVLRQRLREQGARISIVNNEYRKNWDAICRTFERHAA